MLSVEQKMVIYCDKTFVVPEQKTVDNRCFMCLQKWNRSLVKVLTGQALDLRAGQHEKGSLNSNLWNEIVEARQNKANELLQDAIANEAEDGKEEVKKRKKSQPLRASSKHSVFASRFHGGGSSGSQAATAPGRGGQANHMDRVHGRQHSLAPDPSARQ